MSPRQAHRGFCAEDAIALLPSRTWPREAECKIAGRREIFMSRLLGIRNAGNAITLFGCRRCRRSTRRGHSACRRCSRPAEVAVPVVRAGVSTRRVGVRFRLPMVAQLSDASQKVTLADYSGRTRVRHTLGIHGIDARSVTRRPATAASGCSNSHVPRACGNRGTKPPQQYRRRRPGRSFRSWLQPTPSMTSG